MEGPGTVIVSIVALTLFLILLTALKYAVRDPFTRTRLIMTGFFVFIVTTLTVSYWEFFFDTLPFTVPAGALGVLVGWLVGVRAAEKRLHTHGLTHYMEHFAHIHIKDISAFNWWAVVNFYSVMSALALINLVGFTTVIFHNLMPLTLLTSAVGAFLIGSIIPYLTHLWSISVRQKRSRRRSER